MDWDETNPTRWDVFCRNWYGWGRPDAHWWILGIEPGVAQDEIVRCGSIAAALECRGAAWAQLGASATVDYIGFHDLIKQRQWRRKFQPTWGKVLKVRDVAMANPAEGRLARVIAAQENAARLAEPPETAVAYIDVWPLPNSNVSTWYGSLLQNAPAYLRDRVSYYGTIAPGRRQWLRDALATRPDGTVVVVAGQALAEEVRGHVVDRRAWDQPLEAALTGPDKFRIVQLPAGGVLLHMKQGQLRDEYLELLGERLSPYFR